MLKIKNWVLQTCGKGGHHVSTTQMAPQSLDSKKKSLNQPWNIYLKHGTSKVPCFICLGATWLYYQMSPLLCINLQHLDQI
jgi:hypothetical protein